MIRVFVLCRYNKREKKVEKDILKQGIRLPRSNPTAEEPLPSAMPLPPCLQQLDFPEPFVFQLPINTTGQANVQGSTSRPPPPTSQQRLLPLSIKPLQTNSQPEAHQLPLEAIQTAKTMNRSKFY